MRLWHKPNTLGTAVVPDVVLVSLGLDELEDESGLWDNCVGAATVVLRTGIGAMSAHESPFGDMDDCGPSGQCRKWLVSIGFSDMLS